jgi:hypothetical protein
MRFIFYFFFIKKIILYKYIMTTTTSNNSQTCYLSLPSTLSVSVPSGWSNVFIYIIISFISAFILIFVLARCAHKRLSFTFPTILSFILLFSLFFLILSSMGKNLVSISVPSVVSSGPTHLGLDGVSKDNYYAGKKM